MIKNIRNIVLKTTVILAMGTGSVFAQTNETNVTTKKPEITEILWYGCVHCFHMEERTRNFVTQNKDKISFNTLHAVGGSFNNGAKLFYALQSLGVEEQLRNKIFNEIFNKRNPILSSKEKRGIFLKENGLDPDNVEKVMDSFSIDLKMKAAKNIQDKYEIQGTPSYIFNNELTSFVTSPPKAGGYDQTIEVLQKALK